MSFHDAQTPEDLPPSHQGEWWEPPCEFGDYEVADEPEESDGTDE